MNGIELILTSGRGDEIGWLPVVGVKIAPAGEVEVDKPNETVAIRIGDLYALILEAASAEGFESAVDETEFRISVSRALVMHTGDGPVRMPIVVREAPGSGSAANSALSDFDDLFDAGGVVAPEGGDAHG